MLPTLSANEDIAGSEDKAPREEGENGPVKY
jgi:hypothetical protein